MTVVRKLGFSGAVLLGVSGILWACGTAPVGGSSGLDATSFGKKYQLADGAVTGWKQSTDGTAYAVFTANTLSDRIDGAAPSYVTRGCRVAMYQELVGPNSHLCTIAAMDFVTDAQATAMVTYQRNQTSASIAVPQYDASVAIGAETLTGITVYAHIKATYLELILDGYADQTTAAQDAQRLLDVLKAKAQ